MNIAVIGLGSMGKRRIRLIHEMYPDYNIFGVDTRQDRINESAKLLTGGGGLMCFNFLEEISEDVNCAFVCTSPLSHADIISQCLSKGWHVFTELNLVDKGYSRNIALSHQKKLKLFLSSTFLYREEIKFIRSRISTNLKWNYIYHIGQYLPDWHPWENYRDFFIGHKETNGCREIMAIEFPWLVMTFGEVSEIRVLSDRITTLNIDYDDNYMLQVQHKNGNKGVIVVDVVSPHAERKFEAYTENHYISWDGTPESLREYNTENKTLEPPELSEKAERQEGYNAFVVENAYKAEIREFFDVVTKDKKPVYDFEKDREILALIDKIGA